MKRILMVLAISLLMAAMMVAMGLPAFAQGLGPPGVGPVQAYQVAEPPGPPGPSPPLAFGGSEPAAGFNACHGLDVGPGSPFQCP